MDDKYKAAVKLVDQLERAVKAYQDLCSHYRIGKHPSEALFNRLDKAKQALAATEQWRKENG